MWISISRKEERSPNARSLNTFILASLSSLFALMKIIICFLPQDWRCRSRAFCAIEDALKSPDNLYRVQPVLDSLLQSLQIPEKQAEVIEDQKRLLSNLISRLPLDNLEDRISLIITGACKMGGSGANIVGKALMQRLPTAAIVHRLFSDEFLNAKNSKSRENALNMVIFALQTFPSTYFDVGLCVEQTAKAALDKKKRVRQAALDVLAILGQISSPRTVIDKVSYVAVGRKDETQFVAAVKARLARKLLPTVSADGEVQYALKIPSPYSIEPIAMFGTDVEWICSGSGSVSPNSMKNRSLQPNQEPAAVTVQPPFEEQRRSES